MCRYLDAGQRACLLILGLSDRLSKCIQLPAASVKIRQALQMVELIAAEQQLNAHSLGSRFPQVCCNIAPQCIYNQQHRIFDVLYEIMQHISTRTRASFRKVHEIFFLPAHMCQRGEISREAPALCTEICKKLLDNAAVPALAAEKDRWRSQCRLVCDRELQPLQTCLHQVEE